MATSRRPTRALSSAQRAGIEIRREDQDRTLHAIHRLEHAVGAAAPGRADTWRQRVLAALVALDEATGEESWNANQPDSLLSDIARTQPRLRHRVHGIRAQYAQARQAITALRDEITQPNAGDSTDFADLRQQVARLTSALRYQRARESDLIYEAYYDAFDTDVESDTHRRAGDDAGGSLDEI